MKISSQIPVLALLIVAGFFAGSCNNNSNTSNEGSNKPDTAVQKKVDTTKTAPTAPNGKVVTGADIDLHAIGNTMADMHYDISEIHVPAHTKIKITLTNEGTDAAMMHNVVIVKPEDADTVASEGVLAGLNKGFVPDDKAHVIAASKLTQPGSKTVLTFISPDKGSYLFMCTYPGHYKIMRGKFIVE